MEWIAKVIANDLLEALAHARWITSTKLLGQESTLQIPATNAALLALNDAWGLSEAAKQQEASVSGIYPIDRANRPPFRTGNVLGTWLTAVRLGNLAFLSMPGEPFPEVRLALAQATSASTVVALSKGQDDFGYFFPAYDYVFPELYNSDHAIFNVAPQAGDQIIAGQQANLTALGFKTGSPFAQPLANQYFQKLKPGLQALASPPTGDADRTGRFTTTLQAIYMPASVADAPLAGPVHWSFGDGTQADTPYLSVGQDFGQTGQAPHGRPLFKHAFRPGTYRVVANGQDTDGNTVSWAITVRVFPRLVASASCRGGVLRASVKGGEGVVLRKTWRISGGTRRIATLAVLDAAGGQAGARVRCG
jgi:hypothetical protein